MKQVLAKIAKIMKLMKFRTVRIVLIFSFFTFLGTISNNIWAQEKNYRDYHNLINKAEECCFIKNNVDSCFYYFTKAFSSYDFVFAKDCIEAAQIALNNNRENLLFDFLKKAFQNGFKLSNLYDITNNEGFTASFYRIDTTSNFYNRLLKMYPEARKHFIKRINFGVLNIITRIAAIDRAYKSNPYDYFTFSIFEKNFKSIDSLLKLDLFPSEKIVGIDQENIFKEMGIPFHDLNDWYDILKNLSGVKTYKSLFNLRENEISSMLVYAPLYHYDSTYTAIKMSIPHLIESGLMHPREIASLHDKYVIMFVMKAFTKGKMESFPIVSSAGSNILFFDQSKENRKNVNALRRTYNIASIETDSAKKAYEKRTGAVFYTSYKMHR